MFTIKSVIKDKTIIQEALTIDVINLCGLHKLIDFNLLDKKFKDLWFALFTKYTPHLLSTKKINCVERINKSANLNLISLCDDNHLKLIVEYTTFRIKHLQQLNNLLNDFNNSNINETFRVFYLNNPYDITIYPYLEYENGECYETI